MKQKIGKFREAFLGKVINNELTPAEELFVLANAYTHSKMLRKAAIISDTDDLFLHVIEEEMNVTRNYLSCCLNWQYEMQRRVMPLFGTRLREYQYQLLSRADKYPDQTFKII